MGPENADRNLPNLDGTKCASSGTVYYITYVGLSKFPRNEINLQIALSKIYVGIYGTAEPKLLTKITETYFWLANVYRF